MRAKRFRWIENIHYRRIDPNENNGMKYEMIADMVHRGANGLQKTIPAGYQSDGATCAIDLCPEGFFVHDAFCDDPHWDDGTPITNWEASREYRYILKRNGKKIRSVIRFYATFLFGGGRIKKIGGWV